MSPEILEYAPLILVILIFVWQYKVFVTPEQLERKHREIIDDIASKYTTKTEAENLEDKLDDMQHKIDMIYEKLIN